MILDKIYINVNVQRKKIKERFSKKENISTDSLSEMIPKKDYPLKKLILEGGHILFSNSIIILSVSILIINFIFSIMLNTFSSNELTSGKRNFEIVTLESETYAIIYHNDGKYFLEKATINDKEITIYTREQKIFTSDNISFTIGFAIID